MSLKFDTSFAPAPQTERGHSTLLGTDPKGKNRLVFGCGKNVVIRSVEKGSELDVELYSQHSLPVTVARYSPSGFYIASGDEGGNVRVWATNNEDRTLKYSTKLFVGAVVDLDWSPDSQRIVAVGHGKDQYAAVFLWDVGTTLGDIHGHSKPIITCSFRPCRPFRVVTGSEDSLVNFHTGPPFKLESTSSVHAGFVNCVRYSPDGQVFATAGGDGKIHLFVGKTGEYIAPFSSEGGHKGTVYSLAWSDDSKFLVSSAADKTCKLWNAEEKVVISTWTTETKTFHGMQVGNAWLPCGVVSLALDGSVHILDPSGGELKHIRTIHGHQRGVTSLALDEKSGHVISASFDGTVIEWEIGVGSVRRFKGKGHTASVSRLLIRDSKLVSVSVDQSMIYSSLEDGTFGAPVALKGGVVDMELLPTAELLLTEDACITVQEGRLVDVQPLDFVATCMCATRTGDLVYIGGKDMIIRVFDRSEDGKLTLKRGMEGHRGELTCLRMSPNGSMIAAGDSNREIIIWDAVSTERVVSGFVHHTSRVTSLSWNSSSTLLVSAAVDGCIILWDVDNKQKLDIVRNAHNGVVNTVLFVRDDLVATGGSDAVVKTWSVARV